MREIKKLAIVLGCALLFIVFYFLCAGSAKSAKDYYASGGGGTTDVENFQNVSIEDDIHRYVVKNMEKEVKITGTGDIMFYDYQMERAYDSEKGTFDFSPSFQYISKYLADSSYVLGNFEGTMAGKDQGASSNTYGYWADSQNMNFNIPEAAAADLKAAGFDMLTTANNHVLDSKLEGAASTIDVITSAGLEQTGTFKTSNDARYVIKNIDGINVGIIAYTNFVNAQMSEDETYLVNNLDQFTDSKISLMCSQIEEMRSSGAEYVVVNLHFGEKYGASVSDAEKSLAKRLVEAGADVIFGSYPHVVKPMEVISVQNNDGSTRTGLVFYSLGNFISSMQYQSSNGYPRDLGAVVSVLITKTRNGVRLDGVEIVPTYVDWTDEDIAVLPVCEAHDNKEAFADRFEGDDGAYLDEERINSGYDSVIKTLIGDSGLTYTYSDYKYKISFEK